MSYRVTTARTRQLLREASAKGHENRWGKTREVRAEKRAKVLAHYGETGNMRTTARAFGCSSSWVWQVVTQSRAAFPVDAPEVHNG